MLIGLSLSLCVRDMVWRYVQPEDVAYIIAAIDTRDKKEYSLLERALDLQDGNVFEKVLDSYKHTYWEACPNRATGLASSLWHSGKILRPREQDGPILNIADGHWLVCNQVGWSVLYNADFDAGSGIKWHLGGA
jgi:hypothetical protein